MTRSSPSITTICIGLALAATLAVVAGMAISGPSGAAAQAASVDARLAQNAGGLLHDPRTPVLGNPRGDVTIVEFFDYACPYCKAAEPRVEALLKADKGVKLIVKEFPVLGPESVVASKVALAAAKQGRYAAFHQALLSNKGPLNEEVIFDTAKDVGLDMARLRKDMTAPDISDEIAANFRLARAADVPGTPTFIVDGRLLTQPSATIDFPQVVAAARRAG